MLHSTQLLIYFKLKQKPWPIKNVAPWSLNNET